MTAFADIRGARIAYEVSGEGLPLLLIHGAEGSRRSFDRVIAELGRNYTVVTYDQRDCGDTENLEMATTIADLAADASELISVLGFAEVFVFGTSFGGRVAQAMAVNHPAAVRRLILASTWPLPRSLVDLNRDVAVEVAALREGLPETAERLAPYFFPEMFLADNPQYRGHFGRARPRSDRSARRTQTVGEYPDLDLASITCPTLLVAGELDRLVPPHLTLDMQHQLKEAEAAVLPGVGHISCIQDPKLIALHIKRFCI
jgi:pimeloyl-ACP methyl ester carboxylesterase